MVKTTRRRRLLGGELAVIVCGVQAVRVKGDEMNGVKACEREESSSDSKRSGWGARMASRSALLKEDVKDTLSGNNMRYLTSRDEVPSNTRDWISLGSNEKPMRRE